MIARLRSRLPLDTTSAALTGHTRPVSATNQKSGGEAWTEEKLTVPRRGAWLTN